MRAKKILLLWYQRGDNFGDVLLYSTTRKYLESAGYCVESHEVGDSAVDIAVHANQCNFMLFAGGGIIERFVPHVIQDIRELKELLRVPYGVIGLGVGTFNYDKYADALKYWVDQAEFFYVRDAATRDYLNEISGSAKVIFSGDVVFANKMIVKNIQKGNGIGLNLRDIPYTDVQGEFDWKLVNDASQKAKCNILIPDSHDQISNLQIIFDNQADVENYKCLNRESKIEEVLSAIQKCHTVIAMRFHVVLAAALMGVIPIPILYCPKVSYLAEQLGIMELAIELGEWEKMPEKAELAQRNRDKYFKKMEANIFVLQKKVRDMYINVLDNIERNGV